MTTTTVALDALAVTRSDVGLALDAVGLAVYDELGGTHSAPCLVVGRPSIERYEAAVTVLEWPVILLVNPKTPMESQHLADGWVWATWKALGGGGIVHLDQRQYIAERAEPGVDTFGDQEFPTYRLTVTFQLHSTFCLD